MVFVVFPCCVRAGNRCTGVLPLAEGQAGRWQAAAGPTLTLSPRLAAPSLPQDTMPLGLDVAAYSVSGETALRVAAALNVHVPGTL